MHFVPISNDRCFVQRIYCTHCSIKNDLPIQATIHILPSFQSHWSHTYFAARTSQTWRAGGGCAAPGVSNTTGLLRSLSPSHVPHADEHIHSFTHSFVTPNQLPPTHLRSIFFTFPSKNHIFRLSRYPSTPKNKPHKPHKHHKKINNMFAKATIFAILAVAARVAVATPPACLLAAVK